MPTRPLSIGIVAAAVVLAACGDSNGPVNERGVWKYGVTPENSAPATAAGPAKASSWRPPMVATAPRSSEPEALAPAPAPTAAPTAAPTPGPTAAPTPEPARPSQSAGAYKVVEVKDGGTLRVLCRLAAPHDALPKLLMFKDEEKCGHEKGHLMESERLVWDPKTLGVGNCLVRLRTVAAGKDWGEPMRSDDRSFSLDQKGCHYYPHLAVVRAETQVVVLNSDAADHNIHGYRDATNTGQLSDTKFNFGSAPGSKADPQAAFLEAVGVYIVKCDIHPWMSGHIVVVPHPYYDVTAAMKDGARGREAGEALIESIPPGDYEVEMWHEGVVETENKINGVTNSVVYSPPFFERRQVTVKPGDNRLEITFTAR